MAALKNHYRVLGVSRRESPEGIRRAFRRLARECHPDCTGPDGVIQFQEIAEAHEVLSDPVRRRELDAALGRVERNTPLGAHAEPLRPDGHTRPQWSTNGGAPLRDVDATRRGREPPSRLRELELVLSPREARRGGKLPLTLSTRRKCATCRGQGGFYWKGTPCPECRGTGRVVMQHTLELGLPAGLREGDQLEAKIATRSMPSLALTLSLKVRVPPIR